MCLVTSSSNPTSWFMDSSTSSHICQDQGQFVDYSRRSTHQHVLLGGNTKLEIIGEGSVHLSLQSGQELRSRHVLHVLNMTKNLISVRKLAADKSHTKKFQNNACKVYRHGQLLAEAKLENDLYLLKAYHLAMPEVHTVDGQDRKLGRGQDLARTSRTS